MAAPARPRLARLAAALAVTAVVYPAASFAAPRAVERVTVAVAGDSVVESTLTPDGLTAGLAPQLNRALVHHGFSAGGPGFAPAMLPRFAFSHPIRPGLPIPPGAWRLNGYGSDSVDGPSGYSATAASASAVASVRVRGPQVGILYTTTRSVTPFTALAAGRKWRLNAHAAGAPGAATAWLTLPKGARTLTVRGPSRGTLVLGGVIDRRPPRPGRAQAEVENLGHIRLLPQEALAPRIVRAVTAQRFDVTVLLWGYLTEVTGDPEPRPGDAGDLYERGLLGRARVARRGGGRCLVADTSPIPVPAIVSARFALIHQRVARAAGCTYSHALASLWTDPETAFERGYTLVDNTHPSSFGYRLIAEALAPDVARLARARLAARH